MDLGVLAAIFVIDVTTSCATRAAIFVADGGRKE
jgi:hypothetical protein